MVPVAVSTDTDYCHLSTKLLSPVLSLWAFLTISNSQGNVQAEWRAVHRPRSGWNRIPCRNYVLKWKPNKYDTAQSASSDCPVTSLHKNYFLSLWNLHCTEKSFSLHPIYRASFHWYSQIPRAYNTHLCATACFHLEIINRSVGTK